MSLKIKFKIIVFFILFSNVVFSKAKNIDIYLIIDDNNINKSECEEWGRSIFLDSKLKISSFKIYLNSFKDSQFPDTWYDKKKKKSISFYPQKISCDYSPCDQLASFVREFSKGKSKLFVGDGAFSCDLRTIGIEVGYFKNTSASIYSKIEEEILLNKKIGKDLALFFYIPSAVALDKPFVKIKETDIQLKRGESIEITPEKSKTTNLKWEKEDGISSKDGNTIKLSPKETTTYFVFAENDNGCKSESIEITVNVKKQCFNNYQAASINYNADEHLYRQNISYKSRWNVASSQPGSDIYYLVCNKNCADNVEVRLLDDANARVWSQSFKREDIESGNKLHFSFPDNFIIKVNLNSLSNFNKRKYYRFEILSNDDEGNVYKRYISPRSKFVECGL